MKTLLMTLMVMGTVLVSNKAQAAEVASTDVSCQAKANKQLSEEGGLMASDSSERPETESTGA